MLATAELNHYALSSKRLWKRYCRTRGHEFHAYTETLLPDMHVNWSKIEMVRQHLASSTSDMVVLVDADTYACNEQSCLLEMLAPHASKEIVFSRDCRRVGSWLLPTNISAALRYRTASLPNAGFIAIRNGRFARRFFDDWLQLAKGSLSDLANRHPRNQRVLWEGLYFQNLARLGLFGHQIQRVYSRDGVQAAGRRGAKFVHVKGGLPARDVQHLIDLMPGLQYRNAINSSQANI
ncbi:MAG: hypothetical protein AAGA00_00615 [Pseudomonadota bacterium]